MGLGGWSDTLCFVRKAEVAVVLAVAIPALWLVTRKAPETVSTTSVPSAEPPPATASSAQAVASDRANRSLQPPSGAPASLTCESARRIVHQARSLLAAPPTAIDPVAFGEAMADWLDPHGLWSAAPDSPVGARIRVLAPELLEELTSPTRVSCPVAEELGESLAAWTRELRGDYLHAATEASPVGIEEGRRLLGLDAFEDGPVARPARDLAKTLGGRVGTLQKTFGASLDGSAGSALSRILPNGDHSGEPGGTPFAWSEVMLAAAVRAYLPQIDPHGGWAPLDEETSLYEIDLEAAPPPRLWRRMTRAALGIRVDEPESQGLAVGDVVLSIDGTDTACLSVEQAEQLSLFDGDQNEKILTVLGASDEVPRQVIVPHTVQSPLSRAAQEGLPSFRVPYGRGAVLVVPIGEVPDDLGEELATTLSVARTEGPYLGVVLDLRGNGGGSTDGANAALGLFVPGVRLFPLRRRDGTVEVERAPVPPLADRYRGPLAVLVDGETASAAEMIAGALLAYHRATVAGTETYGKGCAQEYLDDDAHAGVLRLTTLLYALPDGAPVQRTGIAPSLRVPFVAGKEREATLLHALPPWRGPDVRERRISKEIPWPGHRGTVGPCEDEALCKGLRALGAPRGSVAKGR
jgi:carboxyl-terminal processing protease